MDVIGVIFIFIGLCILSSIVVVELFFALADWETLTRKTLVCFLFILCMIVLAWIAIINKYFNT